MSDNKYHITLASLPDYDKLVAEIYYEDVQIAEISMETEILQLELFPRPDGFPWTVGCAEFVSVLERTAKDLVDGCVPL